MKNEKYMRLALRKAEEGVKNGQSPFAACIVKNEQVIACEHNIVWGSTDITAHGEIHTIRKACKELNTIDLSECEIYSTCEPCPMCFTAIHWAKIKKIYYGARIEDARKFGFNELTVSNSILKNLGGAKIEIEGNLMREDSIKLFKYWKERNGDKVY